MTAMIQWDRGGEARIVAIEGDVLTLDSTSPAPPGARIDGTLAPSGDRVRLKVQGARRDGEGNYRIVGRLIDAARELRARIAQTIAPRDDMR